MSVSFKAIQKGVRYSRPQLAELWRYKGFRPLARGLFRPRGDNKLILFITEGETQRVSAHHYSNRFDGHTLTIDGPMTTDDPTVNADANGEEIHLFHREHPREDFTYHGRVRLVDAQFHTGRPSRFTFEVE